MWRGLVVALTSETAPVFCVAIYHFSAKVIQRSHGRSAVAAAAYRAAADLHDQRVGQSYDFTAKTGVVHSEILLPDGAPARWRDRATLWNEVEASERRKDAVLAREVEFALPRELSQAEGIALARDFVRAQFVARGMVADLNVHWTRAPDGEVTPHAHVMLSMRTIDGDGFGKKQRAWNDVALLREWRRCWAETANARLAQLDHDIRIDHRSYADQGVAFEPQHKIGPAGARREQRGENAERAAEHGEIARRNGEKIIAEPGVVLDALTRQHSTFTRRDLARFVDRHTADRAQFDLVMAKVEAAPELTRLGQDGRGQERFTTRAMLDAEQRMERAGAALGEREAHRVLPTAGERALQAAERGGGTRSARVPSGGSPSAMVRGDEQRQAYQHVTAGPDLALVVGYAGTGKSAMLGVARAAWEAQGYTVRGAALSGIAAEGLEAGSGIASRTLASLEFGWKEGRDTLTSRDVLVVDEAGLVGSRQMERLLSQAQSAGAKVVLIGDPEQLQAIEAGAAFRALAERHGAADISEVRRQSVAWQREATRELATARTAAALERYTAAGMVQPAATREAAKAALVAGWDAVRQASPQASQVILAYTRDDVRALNELARARLRASGQLGPDQAVQTERGERVFAAGDRIMFQRNDRALGAGPGGRGGVAVKNGTLGTVLAVEAGGERLTVQLDGAGGPAGNGAARAVTFAVRDSAQIDHGYAATIHKAQGVTVDRAHVLASQHMDRHAAYVALTRHRDGVALHYGRDEFRDGPTLARTLGRQRLKDTSLDYAAARDGEDLMRRYAAQRGLDSLRPVSAIVVPERQAERQPEPVPRRSKFAGLKLRAGRTAPDLGRPVAEQAAPQSDRSQPAETLDAQLARALGSYSDAWSDAARMERAGLPVLPHQALALARAGQSLEAVRPGLSRDVAAALTQQPTLAQGHGRPEGLAALGRAVEAEGRERLALEARGRAAVRAWDALERDYEAAGKAYDSVAQRQVGSRIEAFAKGLKQDPQLDGVLRERGRELGIAEGSRLERVVQAREIDRALTRSLGVEQGPRERPGQSLGM
jgi:Ti-type conjugative transfer relaxase TraA